MKTNHCWRHYLFVGIVFVTISAISRTRADPLFFKTFSKNRPNSAGTSNRYFWDVFGLFGSKNKAPSSSYNSNVISNSYGATPSYKPSYEPVKPSYEPVKPSYEPVKPSYETVRPSYEPVKPSYGSTKPSYQTIGMSAHF